VPTALLRRALAFRTLAIRTTLGVLCGGVVGVSMAAHGCQAWSLVGQRLTEVGVNSLIAFHAARWLPRRLPSRREFALVHGLGPRVVILRSLTIVINQTPPVVLGIVAGPRAVGLVALALRLVELIGFMIVKPLQGVAQSALAAMRRKHAATDQFYLDLTELAGLCGFTAFAGLALISEPVVLLLAGRDWRVAGEILPAICLAGAVASLTSIQEAYLLALDRLTGFVKATFAEAALGVVLIALAAPYGVLPTAAAVALRALVGLPLRSRATLAVEAIAPMRFLRALSAPCLLGAGMAAPVALWRLSAYGRVPQAAFVAAAIAIGLLCVGALLLGPMPKARARLRSFVQPERLA
jgi:PST family polysaccharide transporter